MPRTVVRAGWGALAWGLVALSTPESSGQQMAPIRSIDQLVRMGPGELDALYQQSGPGPIPVGKTRGKVINYPGTALAAPMAKASRVVWQGKVFREDGTGAVNRFFGVRAIKANVGYGPSWLDGQSSLILDYQETSRLYANVRDEIRQVGPGVYLGLMYTRTTPQPTFKMYFALESRP